MSRTHTHGVTRIEVLVLVIVVALIVGFAAVMLARSRTGARTVSDASNLKQIHQAWLAHSMERKGSLFPLFGGSHDEHVSLHSYMIAMNVLRPDVLCSSNETNPHVEVCRNFRFDAYDPAHGTFGAVTGFTCDLGTKCNTSFAVMPLDKTARRQTHWNGTLRSTFPLLGNRGRKGGVGANWEGSFCFADNHMEFARTPYSKAMPSLQLGEAGTAAVPDNVFRNDTNALPTTNPLRNSDVFLVIQKDAAAEGTFITEDSPEITWD